MTVFGGKSGKNAPNMAFFREARIEALFLAPYFGNFQQILIALDSGKKGKLTIKTWSNK